MKINIILNTIGMIFSTIGTYCIWRFSKTDMLNFIAKNGTFPWEGSSQKDKTEFDRMIKMSQRGICLVLIGFAISLIGDIASYFLY